MGVWFSQLWDVEVDTDGFPSVRHLETLTGHNKGINIIRFSPTGEVLASAVRTLSRLRHLSWFFNSLSLLG